MHAPILRTIQIHLQVKTPHTLFFRVFTLQSSILVSNPPVTCHLSIRQSIAVFFFILASCVVHVLLWVRMSAVL